MKPLSALFYSRNNKKKLIAMVISIGLSISLIYVIQFLVYGAKHGTDYTDLNPLSVYSEISRQGDEPIHGDMINCIVTNEYTERVIPRIRQQTFYYPITGRCAVSVFSLNQEDMTYMMDKLGLTIKEGRLPKNNRDEIVIHDRLLKNKGLKLGDEIGYPVNEKEKSIEKTYKIVGVLDGASMIALTSLSAQKYDSGLYENGMLVFHKEGKRSQSNSFLSFLPKDAVYIQTYQKVYDSQQKDLQDIQRYMNILVVLLIIVISITMGNSSYIHTFQRRYEYALLYSIGYSPLWILRKTIKEVFLTCFLGYLTGMVSTSLIAGIMYLFLFYPQGLVLKLFLPEALLQTLMIPIFVSLFCILPISRMLRRVDPINIIEGVD